MDAIRLLGRSEIRRRGPSLLTITALVALVVGVVLATLAGARRTASVMDRFEAATNAPDGMVGVAWPPLAADDAAIDEIRRTLRAADGVAEVAVSHFVLADAGTKYDFGILTGPDEAYTRIGRPLVRAGRMPALDAPEEIAIPERLAAELDLEVGDRLVVPTMTPASAAAMFEGDGGFRLDGPVLTLDVVGIFRDIDDLRPDSGTAAPLPYAGPAFMEAHAAARAGAFFQIVGDQSEMAAAELLGVVADAAPAGAEVFGGIGTEDDSLRVGYRTLALGLLVFAAMAAATGLLAMWLAIGRHVQQAHGEAGVVASLGMSRGQIALGWAAPLVGSTTVGVCAGALLSVGASGLFPISLARRAEPDPGIRFDAAVVLIGAAVAAIGVGLLVGVMCWRRVRPLATNRAVARRAPSWWSRFRGGIGLAGAIGTSLVIEPQRGRNATFPLTAIAGAVIAVGGVVGIAVFDASQRAVNGDATRFGYDWSAQPDLNPGELDEGVDAFVEHLAADARIDAVGGLFCDLGGSLGDDAAVCALRVASGSMAPVVTAGRAPSAPGEIALGSITAERLGVGVGDPVTIGDGIVFTVVGETVMPTTDTDRPGLGAYVSEAGLARVTGSDDPAEHTVQRLVLRYAPQADHDELVDALTSDYPALVFSAYSTPEAPELVLQLGQLRGVLVALAGFLGVLAAIGMLHYLMLSVRRRRPETAVLQALGFVRLQVGSVTAWQAITIAAVGVLLGVPLGLVVGRWVWQVLVDDLGMIDTPANPWPVLLLAPLTFVVGALLLALFPAWRSTRVRPALALRGE